MQLSTLIFTASLLVTSVLAGWNCKCQDENDQYNWATETCCIVNNSAEHVYHPDQHHQCSSRTGNLDNGDFDRCCRKEVSVGAFCW